MLILKGLGSWRRFLYISKDLANNHINSTRGDTGIAVDMFLDHMCRNSGFSGSLDSEVMH